MAGGGRGGPSLLLASDGGPRLPSWAHVREELLGISVGICGLRPWERAVPTPSWDSETPVRGPCVVSVPGYAFAACPLSHSS